VTVRAFAFVAALVFVATAWPRPGSATGAAAGEMVSLVPLFDTHARFKPKKTFKLRFRATRKGAPVPASEISFSLRHGRDEASAGLKALEVKPGVFEVRFKPLGPGQYAVIASVLGGPAESLPPVPLGVVGLADGIVEVPPDEDAAVMKQHRGRSPAKLAR
jgi:hypothetical protein